MDKVALYRQVLRLFKYAFPSFSLPQVKMLAAITVAFWFTDSIRLWSFATHLPFPDVSNAKYLYNRLVRFLDKFQSDNLEFWKQYVRLVFSLPYFRFKRRKYITLLLDFTTLRDNYLVLGAAVSLKGRAIPVYLKIWEDPNRKYDFWKRVQNFLEELKKILPEGKEYEVIADRGFQGDKLVRICLDLGWEYIIRINGNYLVQVGDKNYIQLSLFDAGIYYDVIVGKRSKEVTNLVVNELESEDGNKLKWYLKSSLRDKERIVQDYERRMWIEEGIKDLKGYLKWESYTKKIPEKGRLKKIVICSILSYAIGLSMGIRYEEVEEGKDIEVGRQEGLYRKFINRINMSIEKVKSFLKIIVVLGIQYLLRNKGFFA